MPLGLTREHCPRCKELTIFKAGHCIHCPKPRSHEKKPEAGQRQNIENPWRREQRRPK